MILAVQKDQAIGIVEPALFPLARIERMYGPLPGGKVELGTIFFLVEVGRCGEHVCLRVLFSVQRDLCGAAAEAFDLRFGQGTVPEGDIVDLPLPAGVDRAAVRLPADEGRFGVASSQRSCRGRLVHQDASDEHGERPAVVTAEEGVPLFRADLRERNHDLGHVRSVPGS